MPLPRIAAHRGASARALENTLAAMHRAVADGADGAEFDVHATADGALVVHHDPDLPGFGPIARCTLNEVRRHRLANGEPVPTLADVLAALPDRTAYVELKALPPECDEQLLATLDAASAPSRLAVHSFDHRIIARLRQRRPTLATGALQASYPLDPLGAARAAGAQALWQHWELIDATLVRLAHHAGLEVIAWTVPTREAARLAALGVDVLCGNDPEALRAALEAGVPHQEQT